MQGLKLLHFPLNSLILCRCVPVSLPGSLSLCTCVPASLYARVTVYLSPMGKLSLYLKLRSKRFAYRFCSIPQPGKWVFIVGCYNSGTTLLHDLLARHPDVGSMPNEGQFFTDQLMTGAKAGVRRLWALKPELFKMDETSSGVDVGKLKKEWAYFYNDASRKVLIEKTIANSARTRWLQKHFQPAYFICIFRNGYAVTEGIHRKEKHDIETAAKQWNVSNELLLGDMQHLQNKLTITYESLTYSPAEVMKSVTAFLGISPLPDNVFNSSFNIHEQNSKIQDMNEGSFRRLTTEQIETINSIAGNTLDKLGYQRMFQPLK